MRKQKLGIETSNSLTENYDSSEVTFLTDEFQNFFGTQILKIRIKQGFSFFTRLYMRCWPLFPNGGTRKNQRSKVFHDT